LLASIRQSNLVNGNLPSTIATADTRPQGAGNNLVAEADTNNGLLLLLKNSPDILSETNDPRIIREAVMFLNTTLIPILDCDSPEGKYILLPEIRRASYSFGSG
jgi:hypothetical protein